MNYFIIGGDKKEYGPATTEQVREWLRENRANGETLLRLEGETLWKPLRSYAEFANDLPKGPPVAETTASVAAGGEELPAGTIRVGHAFARAWQLVGEHFGVIAGATVLTWMALTALFFTPCLGPLLLVPLEGPLYGGLFLVFLKLIRTGEASALDVFNWGGANAPSLMLANVLITIVSTIGLCACVLPGIYLKIAWLLAIPLIADQGLDFWRGMETSRRVVTPRWFKFCGLFLIAFLPVVVFQIYMQYRIGVEMQPEIAKVIAGGSREAFMKAASEIARRNQWLPIAGQFMLLLTLPIGMGTLAFVYEDLFRRRPQTAG